MEYFKNRIHTFNKWSNRNFATNLAITGFYFIGNKTIKHNNICIKVPVTKCGFCEIEIGWHKETDIPSQVHEHFSTFCPLFVKDKFSREENRLKSFENWNGKVSKFLLAKNGFFYLDYLDAVQCYSCLIALKDWSENDDPEIIHKLVSKNCSHVNTIFDYLCCICSENNKNICFLPCAHIVCCSVCSMKISECPLCKCNIDQKLRVYL